MPPAVIIVEVVLSVVIVVVVEVVVVGLVARVSVAVHATSRHIQTDNGRSKHIGVISGGTENGLSLFGVGTDPHFISRPTPQAWSTLFRPKLRH